MNEPMTRAQRILDPEAAAERDARIRKENIRRTTLLKQVAEALLTNEAFKTWMQLQLESVHFMRPTLKREDDFSRGHRHCVEEQLFRLVGAGGKAGTEFMRGIASRYAGLARGYFETPINQDKE